MVVHSGEFTHLGWMCHLSSLLIGIGLLSRRPLLNGVGLLWLVVGTPLWIFENTQNIDNFVWTSTLTHGLGPLIAILGIRELGWRRGSWSRAGIGLIFLQPLSWVIPGAEEANLNLAFRTWHGFESVFPDHFLFLVTVVLICTAIFYGVDRLIGRICGVPGADQSPPADA
jgi:hypothetical protein